MQAGKTHYRKSMEVELELISFNFNIFRSMLH